MCASESFAHDRLKMAPEQRSTITIEWLDQQAQALGIASVTRCDVCGSDKVYQAEAYGTIGYRCDDCGTATYPDGIRHRR